jgi:hypothetical protein
MKPLLTISAMLGVLFAGGCAPTPVATVQIYNPADSYQEYVQRSDKVTLTAGDAQEVNSRIHEIDPWPRNVGNTHIAVNGDRMVDAMYRYRCNKAAPEPLATLDTLSNSGGGSTATAAATAAGARPGTECAGAQGSQK